MPPKPLVYLAGAIEHAPDGGEGWRRALIPHLRDELSCDVYDPTADEAQWLTEEERANFRRWKTEDFSRFQRAIRKVIAKDLSILERASLVVCLWDDHVRRGGGTHGEMTLAHVWGKPVHLVLGMPVAEVSSWILGCATEVHADFDSLRRRLAALRPGL
ncbi:MAG: hypothetical protein HUU25_14895 [Candidatus Sumerlaeia bacterium]|nr:hypothetical protein [Candidatus Sumerlaeia bacterium]